MIRFVCLVVAFFFAAVASAPAQTPRTVTWDNLLPPKTEYPKDPLESLTEEQRLDLGLVARAREIKNRTELAEDSGFLEDAREAEKNLRRAGIDIDGLIVKARAADAELYRIDQMVNASLDEQFIRMPGYVLPLEYAGSKVTEFLLVPFVGACIHVPPPPPNQIVHVKVKDGFEDTGIFTPVYVTGRMTAGGGISKSVFLTDGKVNVSFGYGLQATAIEKYRE